MALRRLTNAVKPAYVKFQHPITKATVYFNTSSFSFCFSSTSWEMRSPCRKLRIRKDSNGIRITVEDPDKRENNSLTCISIRTARERNHYSRIISKYLL